MEVAITPAMIESPDRHWAKDIFCAALRAVDPYKAVEGQIAHILSVYKGGGFNRLLLISFGKAAFLMTKAVADAVPGLITRGIVITKYGHVMVGHFPACVEVCEAGHPIPDKSGLKATNRAIEILKEANEKTLVLCLISGGGSALLMAPKGGVALSDKRTTTELLLKAGVSIDELNTVRKHISDIKGGRLAELAYPAQIISLILSDVIGDKLDVIASGPTSPDNTTYGMALDVVKKYGLTDRLPKTVVDILDGGAKGRIADTPKEGDPIFAHVENIIVGSNLRAAQAAEERARYLGFDTTILSTGLEGDARNIARQLAKKAIVAKESLRGKTDKKICLISGGETTVAVMGNGKGGRNTELALAFALEIEGKPGIALLSAGTDGTDGPTDAAGAMVNGETIPRAKALSLDPEKYLANNDSYNFFSKTGELLITGPTGTNVMDLQIILIE